MPPMKKCLCNPDWVKAEISEYASWIRAGPNDATRAHCAACQKTFSLSNMGNTAVSSHAASKRHQAAVSSTQSASQTNIHAFFSTGSDLPCSATAARDCAAVVPRGGSPGPFLKGNMGIVVVESRGAG